MKMTKTITDNNRTFAAVSSVANKSRFACTVVGSPSVATNGIDMATMLAFYFKSYKLQGTPRIPSAQAYLTMSSEF